MKVWSELALLGGRLNLALAERLIEQLNERIEQLGLLYLQAPAMYSELFCHLYAGRADSAEHIGQRLHDITKASGHAFSRGLCLLLRGLQAYRQRQMKEASISLEAGLDIFSHPATKSPLHYHEFSIAAGLVHMHLGNWQEAETFLLKALHHFRRIANHLASADALLSLALLGEQQGKRLEALEYLEQGLRLAAEHRFTHFVVISPQDQIRLCLLALKAGTQSAANQAKHLLQAGLLDTLAREEKTLRQTYPHPRVQKTIKQLMLSWHRSKQPRVFIQTLGCFRVWLGEHVLADSSWEGNQARNLLKAIVALAWEGQVRKELLIEELWPDSRPEAAEKTFKVALHRLRRTLDPDMSQGFGSSYIHLQKGRVCLDWELCQTDVRRFLQLCTEVKAQLKTAGVKRGLKTFNQAVALYKGDFLPDDLDAEWARAVRELLRQKYIALLIEAAHTYERFGTWTKAVRNYELALDCDPLLEEAYRRIMVLYADMGKRTMALKTYETCRTALRNSLDIEPEDQTTSLYLKIRG
ncbi:MAG: tetratricopeptide repeat protein [Desulfohalobiaceae bacterium]|nr:tetratricopeptide repeat protein [Desulfohalobiaceae bacterium]